MAVFLVQLPTSHKGAGERVYPLGLARLAATLAADIPRYALDMNMAADPWQELADRLMEIQPRLIALSFRNIDPLAGVHASYLPSLVTAANLCRHLVPTATIIAGGPAFSLFGKRLMTLIPAIDYGLIGEGEQAFPRLVADPDNPGAVPGLIWRNGERLITNPPAKPMDLARLPLLVKPAFDPAAYQGQNAYIASMGIEGKRGCNLACGYCVYPKLGGSCMRLRDPDRIADEMAMLHREHGVRLFHFTDSVVNRPPAHFKAVCRAIIQRRLTIGWTGFFREDQLDDATLGLARDAGLVAVYFSADALTDHGLSLLNKRLQPADILAAAELTARHKILTMCHFLVNLPHETERHRRQGRIMLERLLAIHHRAGNLGAVILNTVRLYPDAPLTRQLLAEKLLDPRLDLLYPVYYNPPATAHTLHQLDALCQEAGVFSRLGLPHQAFSASPAVTDQ